jgi:hypothetical protein
MGMPYIGQTTVGQSLSQHMLPCLQALAPSSSSCKPNMQGLAVWALHE